MSVNDQLARLRSGMTKAKRFNYNYLRFEAGRWGIAWGRDMNQDGKGDVLLMSYQNLNDNPTVSRYSGGEAWKRISTLHGSVRAEKYVAALEAGTVVLEMPKWPDLVVGAERVRVYVTP